MANIDLKELFQQKKREFKSDGAVLPRFELDFVSAVNWATSYITRKANLETVIAKITKPDGTVGLSDDHIDVLSDAVTIKLVQFGQRGRGGDIDVQQLIADLPEQVDSVRQSILSRATDADTDNESDFVALGAGSGGVSTGGDNA